MKGINVIHGNNSKFREGRSEKTSEQAAQWLAVSMWEMNIIGSQSNASRWWIFADGNSRVHNKVDLEIISFSLASEALGLNDMILGRILKTKLWYIFLLIVIISHKNVKVLHYKYYRNCFIMGPGRQFWHTLGEKHFLENWELAYWNTPFFKSGHVNLLLIIGFLSRDMRSYPEAVIIGLRRGFS